MVRLITLSNPRMAQAFIDYMASRHIDIQMMPEVVVSSRFGLAMSSTELR